MLSSLLTTLALLGAATARIVGVAAPSTIAAGSNFTITIITENYIQSVLDVSAAFGFTQNLFPGTLGSYLTSTYLGPSQSNILTNISVSANLPSYFAPGNDYHLTAAITSLYGASSSPTTITWSVPVTVANSTSSDISSDLSSSRNGTNICSSSTSAASATSSGTVSTSSSSATSTATAPFGKLDDVIQNGQGGLQSLLADIVGDDLTAAQNNYNNLSPFFDSVKQLAAPDGSCPVVTGQTLTRDEALSLIQTIQGTLNMVSLDVTNGDSDAALTDVCAARAAYFNSGLHEYIFK